MRIERESIRSKKRSRSTFNKEGLIRQALCVNPEVWTCSVTKYKTYLEIFYRGIRAYYITE